MSKDYRTIGQILEQGLTEAKYTNVHNKIKNIKNLSRKEADMIANIDPAVLAKVIQNLTPSFKLMRLINSVEEDVDLNEARIVLSTPMYDAIKKMGLAQLMKKHDAYVNKQQTDKERITLSSPSPMFGRDLRNLIKKNKSKLRKLVPEGVVELDERSALVANQTNILDVVLKDLHAFLLKQMDKGNLEIVNNVARLVGLKITTKGQGKNKAFMYDLEKGFKGGGRGGSSRGR